MQLCLPPRGFNVFFAVHSVCERGNTATLPAVYSVTCALTSAGCCLTSQCLADSVHAWMRFRSRPGEKYGPFCADFNETKKRSAALCGYQISPKSNSKLRHYGQIFIDVSKLSVVLTAPIFTKLTNDKRYYVKICTEFHPHRLHAGNTGRTLF